MPAVITDLFRISNAKTFVDSVSTDNYFVTLGHVKAWPDDNNPPIPYDTIAASQVDAWKDMFAAKKLLASGVSQAIRRNNWTTGTVYAVYRDDAPGLDISQFYVFTSSSNVYKCLDNFGGAPSTVEPTGTGTSVITTADGYRWKFMYQLGSTQAANLLSLQFVPVQTLTSDDGSSQWLVQQDAINSQGTVTNAAVTAGGTGYTGSFAVTITGDGSGAAGTAFTSGGAVTRIQITNPGTGYTYANISVGGGGSGATAHASIAPLGGHGADPVKELFGYYVSIGAAFTYSEGGTITVANDFRKVCLIKDPFLYGSTTQASGTVYNQTSRLSVSGESGTFLADETVTTSTGSGVVVEYDAANHYIYVTEITGTFSVAQTITGGTSGKTASVVTVGTPGLQPYSGTVFYIEQKTPTLRSSSQIENLRFTVEF